MARDSAFIAVAGVILAATLSGCSGPTDVQESMDGTVLRQEDGNSFDETHADDHDLHVEEPMVDLAASPRVVGTSQPVTLSWSSKGVSQCEASGGWQGTQPVSGRVTVGLLSASTTFTLTCNGPGGSAMSMISVAVMGVIALSWQPPTENVDGSPLQSLAGYQIYYGTASSQYDTSVLVQDPNATNRTLELPSGDYFIAMTAIDANGLESAYSNEITRTIL